MAYSTTSSISTTSSKIRIKASSLLFDINESQWPIVYDEKYNVSFLGLEKCHVFDAHKWRNIIRYLKEKGIVNNDTIVKPNPAKRNDLLVVHTRKYLRSLQWSANVAMIAEIPPLAFVPNYLVQKAYLKPMRRQTGGTVLAGKLAIDRGWAINIGGGFHHCSSTKGAGFCPYADITLMIRMLISEGYANTVMIVDLDAHQGNGYQRDFLKVPEVYIMDMYNRNIYPKDTKAREAIKRKVPLPNWVGDKEYLIKLKRSLHHALKEFNPDLVVYNAGTDVLDGDPLGHMSITPEGIIKRDEYVFDFCKKNMIPIVMLTSGGYLKRTAKIIADSIHNLYNQKLIHGCNITNNHATTIFNKANAIELP